MYLKKKITPILGFVLRQALQKNNSNIFVLFSLQGLSLSLCPRSKEKKITPNLGFLLRPTVLPRTKWGKSIGVKEVGKEVCFRQVRPDSCGQDEDGGAEIAMTMIMIYL